MCGRVCLGMDQQQESERLKEGRVWAAFFGIVVS